MIFLYTLFAVCLGAYIGRLMAMAVNFLAPMLLEESSSDGAENHVPREILTWFFQNRTCFKCKQAMVWWQNLPILVTLLGMVNAKIAIKN